MSKMQPLLSDAANEELKAQVLDALKQNNWDAILKISRAAVMLYHDSLYIADDDEH
jgi:hypothetical protein